MFKRTALVFLFFIIADLKTYADDKLCKNTQSCNSNNESSKNDTRITTKKFNSCEEDHDCETKNELCFKKLHRCKCFPPFLKIDGECKLIPEGYWRTYECSTKSDYCYKLLKNSKCDENIRRCRSFQNIKMNDSKYYFNVPCSFDKDCNTSNFEECDTGVRRCRCLRGFIKSNNRTCISIFDTENCTVDDDCKKYVNETCSENSHHCTCLPTHRRVNGKCKEIPDDYHLSYRCDYRNDLCYTLFYGSKCSIDNRCECKKYENIVDKRCVLHKDFCSKLEDCNLKKKSSCDHYIKKCVCKVNYFEQDGVCKPIADFCRVDEDCQAENKFCYTVSNTCICKEGYLEIKGKCIKIESLCNSLYSMCPNNSVCVDRLCECINGYQLDESGRGCIKSKRSNYILKTSIGATAIIIALIICYLTFVKLRLYHNLKKKKIEKEVQNDLNLS